MNRTDLATATFAFAALCFIGMTLALLYFSFTMVSDKSDTDAEFNRCMTYYCKTCPSANQAYCKDYSELYFNLSSPSFSGPFTLEPC